MPELHDTFHKWLESVSLPNTDLDGIRKILEYAFAAGAECGAKEEREQCAREAEKEKCWRAAAAIRARLRSGDVE